MGLKKPGEKANKTGEYLETGPQGGKAPKPRQVTIDDVTDRLPPTQKKGNQWKRVGPPKK